ncbi:hypothetical protein Q8F55_004832 [Vanrija albida]|uniref:F-box domain-containing protein n=1 Tax=Vanrija albida TaxID=181172 RepID=A0ABR3Q078_9TREE
MPARAVRAPAGADTPALAPSPDPRALALNVPHIVDAILASVPRATLLSCLRVNRKLHAAAGKHLYHTVRVDQRNLGSFFRGALLPGAAPSLPWLSSAVRPTAASFKTALLAHVRVLALGTHDPVPGVCTPNPTRRPRVLSLGTCPAGPAHTLLQAICAPGPAALLPNLHTLRIVRAHDASGHRLSPLCGRANYCHLVGKLAPRKLVVRNLDEREDYLPSLFPLPAVDEIVWVLPSDRTRYRDREVTRPGNELALITTRRAKFIFHDTWEVWAPKAVTRFGGASISRSVWVDVLLEVSQSGAESVVVLPWLFHFIPSETSLGDELPRWRRFLPEASTLDEMTAHVNRVTSQSPHPAVIKQRAYEALDPAERAQELDDSVPPALPPVLGLRGSVRDPTTPPTLNMVVECLIA